MVAVAVAVAFALAVAAPAAHAAGPASVHVKSCKTGSDVSHRSATYKAWMSAVPGSVRMSMRFELVAHYPGHEPQTLRNTELSALHKSHKGVTRYGYTQKVTQLRAGGSYRALVRFRWYDSSGHVIKRTRRLSEACVQYGKLPNLLVSGVKAAPGSSPETAVYTVSILNSGEGSAENFSVTLIVDGGVADSRTVARLDPGESTAIDLNGPPCERLHAVVDRERAVPETVETDNSLGSYC